MILTKKILAIGAVVGALLLPVTTQAQSPLDWSGFYVGVQGAVATGTIKVDETFCDTNICGNGGLPPATLADSFIADYGLGGFRGGVHAGYNHQVDTVVVGVVTDLNFSRISGNGVYTFDDGVGGGPFPSATNPSSFNFNWEGSTRIVAGLAMDAWMPYLTAGIAYGHGTLNNVRDYTAPNPVFSTGVSLAGATAGVGVNYAIAENIVLSGEVRHTIYGTALVNEDDGLGNTTTQRVNIGNTAAQIGLSFKF